MNENLAKVIYKPNNIEVVKTGTYVICSVSGKKIQLEKNEVSALRFNLISKLIHFFSFQLCDSFKLFLSKFTH